VALSSGLLRCLGGDEWLITVIKAIVCSYINNGEVEWWSEQEVCCEGWCTSRFCTQSILVHHCVGGLVLEVQRRPTYGNTVRR